MKDRIKEFIEYKGISAGELADFLDVQRSNISHILNGRNKPGAVFLERFLLTFTEINARWLLTGQGEMLNVSSNGDSEANINNLKDSPQMNHTELPLQKKSNSEAEVIKVILLHFDGTFTSYTPG